MALGVGVVWRRLVTSEVLAVFLSELDVDGGLGLEEGLAHGGVVSLAFAEGEVGLLGGDDEVLLGLLVLLGVVALLGGLHAELLE